MPTWVGHYEPLELFCLCTKVHLISFAQRGKGCGRWSFLDVRNVDPFPRYSGSKSKVGRNGAELWTFFSPSQILGGLPSKSYTHFITHTSRYVAWKWFCKDTPISHEVLVVHTHDFKSNFKFSRLKFLRGPPSKFCNVR